MITLTKKEALEIQEQHVEHYVKLYGNKVRQAVVAATTADALIDGIEYDIVTINRHIPRGAAIEALIPEIIEHERRYDEALALFFSEEG